MPATLANKLTFVFSCTR